MPRPFLGIRVRMCSQRLRNLGISPPGMLSATGTRGTLTIPHSMASISEKSLIVQGKSVQSDLITAKIKATRTEQAGNILEGVDFGQCPKCVADISDIDDQPGVCRLSRNIPKSEEAVVSLGLEALRRDLKMYRE